MARLVPLVEAIATGQLGNLDLSLSFADFADRLGPPEAMERGDQDGWIWRYPHLTIKGPLNAAEPVSSISLSRSAFTGGPWAVIGASWKGRTGHRADSGFVLTLDIEGSIRVGAMLDRLAEAGIAAQLGWRQDDDLIELVIRAGAVRLRFAGARDDTASGTPPASLVLPADRLATVYDGVAALEVIEWAADPDDAALQWLDVSAYRRGAEASEPSQVLWWSPTGYRQHPPVSLADVLATGQFGPIALTVTRQDIGRDFGVPTSLGAHSDFWGYGALHFAFMPDGGLELMQIDYVRNFSGPCEIIPTGGFAGPLILMLDGLTGASRPSDVVRLLLARGSACRVAIRIDWNDPNGPAFETAVIAGPSVCRFHDRHLEGHEVHATDPRGLVAAVEARGRLDAIFAYPPLHASAALARWTAGAVEMSAEDYLSLLGIAPPRLLH